MDTLTVGRSGEGVIYRSEDDDLVTGISDESEGVTMPLPRWDRDQPGFRQDDGHSPSEHGEIIDRGRGPELKGTRITVYRIVDFLRGGTPTLEIAQELGITEDQVRAAVAYITANRTQVDADYEAIVSRTNQPNPPHIDEGRSQTREELRKRIKERYSAKDAHDPPVGQ